MRIRSSKVVPDDISEHVGAEVIKERMAKDAWIWAAGQNLIKADVQDLKPEDFVFMGADSYLPKDRKLYTVETYIFHPDKVHGLMSNINNTDDKREMRRLIIDFLKDGENG